MNKILVVEELCKTYITNKRQNHVLKNISFDMEEGDFTAVMGPSGSGKSTLLYTVSGMDQMTAGEVCLNGKHMSGLKADQMSDVRLNEMGFVFQQMHMLRNLTVFDNIVVAAFQSVHGKTKKGRQEIISFTREMMHKLGISEIADHDITEVSGGQLQRACICRALVNHPRILFADEPTGALNSQASREVMHELNRINAEGMTILLVTHDIKVASKTDQILYIVDGHIKGCLKLGRFSDESGEQEREQKLSSWLTKLGW